MIKNWEVASKLSESYNINFIPVLQLYHYISTILQIHFLKVFIQSIVFGIGYSLMNQNNSKSKEKMSSLKFIDASTVFSQ